MKIIEDVCGNKWLVEIPGKSQIVQIDKISYFYATAKNKVALMLSGRECMSIDTTYEEFTNVIFGVTIALEKAKEND